MILLTSPPLGSIPAGPTLNHTRRGHHRRSHLGFSGRFSHVNKPKATLMTHEGKRRCDCFDMHNKLIPYTEAWSWQKSIVKEREVLIGRNEDDSDSLIILQHHPVYTLGTGSSKEYLNFDINNSPYNVYRTERGGEVTYHGPGQLVMYPIINLRYHKMDLHWYLRALEEVIIRVLASTFSIKASRVEGLTGVWVGEEKLAAIGIRVSRWVTYHGIALNVTTDLTPFGQIVPCGIRDRRVGNIKELVRKLFYDGCETSEVYHFINDHQLIDITHKSMLKEFCEVFQLKLCQKPIPILNFSESKPSKVG